MRCFIAIPLDLPHRLEEVKDMLAGQFSSERIRWVTGDRMHLTLRFFGEIDEHVAVEISSRIESCFTGIRGFKAELRGLQTFSDRERRPTVLWAGLNQADRFMNLRKMLDDALVGLKLPASNRHFRPHLTLARIKKLSDREFFLLQVSKYREAHFGSVGVERVILFRSILRSEGPEYSSLAEVPLVTSS